MLTDHAVRHRELLKGCTDVVLLAALEQGPTYGYELARLILLTTEQQLRLKEGTLYPKLHLMADKGWLSTIRLSRQGPSSEARVYYALTVAGKARLVEARQEWAAFERCIDLVVAPERVKP